MAADEPGGGVEAGPLTAPDTRRRPAAPRRRLPTGEHPISIEAVGLAARYRGLPVWSDASFAIGAGEFVAILGPNGAGKSTLFRVLLGLMAPAAGRLSVLGHPPRRGNPRIGYVPQRRTLDPGLRIRGTSFVGLGLDGHRWGVPAPGHRRSDKYGRVHAALMAVGAHDYAGRPIGQLSGGEQQRLVLAQALVSDPALLLLDEPLASLDLRHQASMTELVASLVCDRGLTAALITHDINPLLPFVDRVVYVANRRMAVGKVADVINPETLSRLYGSPIEVLTDSRGRLLTVGPESAIGPAGIGGHWGDCQ